jgi:hypothetical protein
MPEKETLRRAKADKRAGKSASTQAGEFVREEIEHIRHGKHGARSTEQAIAIGLSKARRAGVKLQPPAPGKTSARTRKSAARDYAKGQHPSQAVSRRRSAAASRKLKQASTSVASHAALSKHAKTVSRRRSAATGKGRS